jgi:hypothetical protein
VGLVVCDVDDAAAPPELVTEKLRQAQALTHPARGGVDEGLEAARDRLEKGRHGAIEAQQGLLVEGDDVDLRGRDAADLHAAPDRGERKGSVEPDAREPLLLRRGDEAAVLHEARGAVVIERRDSEDVHQGVRA